MHMADLATDEFQRDLALSLLSSEEDALFQVEEAMRRIELGSYGVCELTRKPIPLARLRAIPWTRFTAEAELELERLGAVDKAHLGKLGRSKLSLRRSLANSNVSNRRKRKSPRSHWKSSQRAWNRQTTKSYRAGPARTMNRTDGHERKWNRHCESRCDGLPTLCDL
jgi:RNA polymerase-binding transcription factor DksA